MIEQSMAKDKDDKYHYNVENVFRFNIQVFLLDNSFQ
jgi:hypothetical protein